MDRSPVLDWDPVLVQQSLSVWVGRLVLVFPHIHVTALAALTPCEGARTALSGLPRPLTTAGQSTTHSQLAPPTEEFHGNHPLQILCLMEVKGQTQNLPFCMEEGWGCTVMWQVETIFTDPPPL